MELKGTDSGRAIRIALLNIRSEQSGVLESALRAQQKGNIGIRILQETKLNGEIHT